MLIISKENINFIKKNIPEADKIINANCTRDALIVFSEWLAFTRKCWDESGYYYSDLGRQAQRVYDDLLYDNVYAHKENA